MTRLKYLLVVLCTYTAYYTVVILIDRRRYKQLTAKPPEEKAVNDELFQTEPVIQQAKRPGTVLVHNTIARSIYAYDNSGHHTLVHVRFDAQTVDLLNKFKMATGTDITKFVAFAVKYLFETNPELKEVIKQFIQNTAL